MLQTRRMQDNKARILYLSNDTSLLLLRKVVGNSIKWCAGLADGLSSGIFIGFSRVSSGRCCGGFDDDPCYGPID